MTWINKVGVIPSGGCPCRECERKGCGAYHDECTEYKEYREKIDDIHKKYSVDYDKMARPEKKKRPERGPLAITHTHKHRS